MSQAEGLIGWVADYAIRRRVRRSFRGVYWIPPKEPLLEPCIIAPNHHGWHDGSVMYLALSALKTRTVTWVQDPDSLMLLGGVGALTFPRADPTNRAGTIRKTLRLMTSQKRNLLLFGEGDLHDPPGVLPFQKGLDFVSAHVPEASTIPVAIRYDMSIHERPECFLIFGSPMPAGDHLGTRTRLAVKRLLDELAVKVRFEPGSFQTLVQGTADAAERRKSR